MMPRVVSSARSRWREKPLTAMRSRPRKLIVARSGRRRLLFRRSASIWPSLNTTTRLAYSLMSSSWVTSTMVIPRSSFMRTSRPMISSLVRESRLPVGSSASSSGAPVTSARAMATRCCCPPDSWLGKCPGPIGQPHRLQRRHGPFAPLAAGHPGVGQRQLDVLLRRRPGQQVEALEHEADLPVADLGPLVPVQGRPRSRRRGSSRRWWAGPGSR